MYIADWTKRSRAGMEEYVRGIYFHYNNEYLCQGCFKGWNKSALIKYVNVLHQQNGK